MKRQNRPLFIAGIVGFGFWSLPGVLAGSWTLAWQLPAALLVVGCVCYTAGRVWTLVIERD